MTACQGQYTAEGLRGWEEAEPQDRSVSEHNKICLAGWRREVGRKCRQL